MSTTLNAARKCNRGYVVQIGARFHAAEPPSTVPRFAAETAYFVLSDDGGSHEGPFTRAELMAKWDRSEVNAQTLFAKLGMASWLPLAVLLPELDHERISPAPRSRKPR